MRAERPDESQGAKQRKQRANGAKPKRTDHHGPIGFANVMGDVAGGKPGSPFGHKRDGQPQDLGTAAMLQMGVVPSTEQVVLAASDGLTTKGAPLVDATTTAAITTTNAQQTAPTHLGNMTPSALLTRVVDEATKLEIEHASKELHVELEPAHLGPLVVSLRRDVNGALDIRFRAGHHIVPDAEHAAHAPHAAPRSIGIAFTRD